MTYKWDFEKLLFGKAKRKRIRTSTHTHTNTHCDEISKARIITTTLSESSITFGKRVRPVEKYIILFLTKKYDRRMINNVFETRKKSTGPRQ